MRGAMEPGRTMKAICVALCAVLGWAGAAQAHPHVWVTAQAEIVFNPEGAVASIRHVWEFDEAYTAFAVQGLDTDKDGKTSRAELAALAKENAESLPEFEFFTGLKVDGRRQTFAAPRDYFMELNDAKLRLVLTLPLTAPAKPKTSVSLEVVDRTFFVSFAFVEGEGAVQLVNAPKGCAVKITRPTTQAPQQALSEQAFQALGDSETVGLQFAPKALVACP